jgi:hypothetical protein
LAVGPWLLAFFRDSELRDGFENFLMLNQNENRGRLNAVSQEPKAKSQKLSSYQPHRPPRHERSAEEHDEAIKPVAHHIACGLAMRDTKDNRGEEREYERGAEMCELNSHCCSVGLEGLEDLADG